MSAAQVDAGQIIHIPLERAWPVARIGGAPEHQLVEDERPVEVGEGDGLEERPLRAGVVNFWLIALSP